MGTVKRIQHFFLIFSSFEYAKLYICKCNFFLLNNFFFRTLVQRAHIQLYLTQGKHFCIFLYFYTAYQAIGILGGSPLLLFVTLFPFCLLFAPPPLSGVDSRSSSVRFCYLLIISDHDLSQQQFKASVFIPSRQPVSKQILR